MILISSHEFDKYLHNCPKGNYRDEIIYMLAQSFLQEIIIIIIYDEISELTCE